MRTRLLALALLVVGASSGCGGRGNRETATPVPPAVAPTTTRTIVGPATFVAALCEAHFTVATSLVSVADGDKLFSQEYGRIVAPPEHKADLDRLVEATRGLGALWSDPNPIEPEEFMRQYMQLSETSSTAMASMVTKCPPPPGPTTTVSRVISARKLIYGVVPEPGRGLRWYTRFVCPEGKRVKLGSHLTPVKGYPDAGSLLDERPAADAPFTGLLANESYSHIDAENAATCV